MRYFFIVGEASADLHASGVMRSLLARDPNAEFMFVGGDLMASQAGRKPLVHYRELAFMGVIPVLRNFGTIRRYARLVQEAMLSFAPDVVIPVDYAGFNMRYILPFVEKHLSCPIIYYIAPKLWAWKRWRMKKLRRYVDLLLCILPFEESFFSSYGVNARYVGNPCIDATEEMRLQIASKAVRQRKQIAILSGSRKQELADNLPTMLKASQSFASDYSVIIAGAPGLVAEDYQEYLKDYPEVTLRFGETYNIISESEVALVTSGTATLETALLGTPLVVCYRMGGWPIRWGWNAFFGVRYFSLINLILRRDAVPELLGAESDSNNIVQQLSHIMVKGEGRGKQLLAFQDLERVLGLDLARERAAEEIVGYLRDRYGTVW